MADTFASFAAKVQRFEHELGDDALGHAVGRVAKDEARKAASADLGGDDRFSGWSKAPLVTRYDIVGPGRVSFHPTPRSAGPWRVADEGRHQNAGPTVRQSSIGVTGRKKRAGRASKWNGQTRGKGTATDALAAIDRALPKVVQTQVSRAIRKVF